MRARYTTADKKKDFVDNLIRFEVMANEAQTRGYDKDPEVVRVMKQQMISKFLQKDFESKLKVEDVPDADVEKYYKDHPAEFNQKDEVRVSEIVVKDKSKADTSAELAAAVTEAEHKLGRTGRVLVRPSGTEPLLRVMVEAPTQDAAQAAAERIAAAVRH